MDPAFPLLSATETRVIRALAERGRTALAAESIGLSQSALSRHMRSAEDKLGVTLFRRGWSGTETTPAGDIAARQCQRVLDRLADFDRAHPPARLLALVRWRHLRTVSACARAGGASAAAMHLNVRQPAISQALREIATFSVPLFDRRRNGLVATDAARRLAALWDEIAADLTLLHQLPDRDPALPGGRVAVGMLPFSGQNLVVETFAELTRDHPRVRLIAIPGSYAMLCDALQRGEIDLIMGTLRQPPPAGFIEEHLYNERYVMIARHDHPCHGEAQTLDTLARLTWSVAPHGTPVRRYFERLFRDVAEPPETQSVEIYSFANAEQIILGSDSVAMLCYGAARLRALPQGLREVQAPLPDATVPVGLTRARGAVSSPAVRDFVTRLRARIAAQA